MTNTSRNTDTDLAVKLALWFKDQDAAPADAAVAMGRLLGLLMGRTAQDVADLEDGLDKLRTAIEGDARRAFIRGSDQ